MATSILLGCSIGANSLVVNAYTYPTKKVTEEQFTGSFTQNYTKVNTHNGVATVRAKNASDSGNYKYVWAGMYTKSSGTWNQHDTSSNTGTTTIVGTNVSTYTSYDAACTNMVAIGQIGYTNIAQTGIKETIVINARASSTDNYVPEYEYL